VSFGCPCVDGLPDPCPKCGATVADGVCGADDFAARYLARLRAVERVLEGGFHDPAQFVARIRGAIGVLPE